MVLVHRIRLDEASAAALEHTGEGRVLVSFTATELFEMATEVVDPKVRARIICALSLIDQDLADAAEGLDGRE